MMRVALAFVPLLLYGILAFDQTFAAMEPPAAKRIQCQFGKTKGDPNSYFLVNRQAALYLGQILIEGLLLNDLKNFVDGKMNRKGGLYNSLFVKDKTKPISFTSEKCLKGIERIRKNYDNKCDLEEIGQIRKNYDNKCDNLPTVGSDINYVIQQFAHADYGLDWIYAKVHSGVMAQCNSLIFKLRLLRANVQNVQTLCQLALQIVYEEYDFNRARFVTFRSQLLDDKIEADGKFYAKCKVDLKKEEAEECRKVQEDCIRLFLYNLWRYALSFVLIYRGDTRIEADDKPADVNWQLKQYYGNDEMPAAEEVAYLTYWPIKMLKQIGHYSSEEYKGDAIAELMLSHVAGGFFHIYMKDRSLRHLFTLDPDYGHCHHNQHKIEEHGPSHSANNDGINAGTFFALSELTVMEANSIEEANKEGSKNYGKKPKDKDTSQPGSSSQSVVPEEPISGQKTQSDEGGKGKAKMI